MPEVRAKSPGRQIRDAMTAGPVMLPGVFNPLVARIAERAGFQAVYLSGAALSASLGLPDVGLVALPEFVDAARAITSATPLPLVCDADTGFGEALNVERTVRSSRLPGSPASTWRTSSCRSAAATCAASNWSRRRRWRPKSGPRPPPAVIPTSC